jgi:tripartite-type tricarboxylate transporter receptor subunit TctC
MGQGREVCGHQSSIARLEWPIIRAVNTEVNELRKDHAQLHASREKQDDAMRLGRRRFLYLAASAAALPVVQPVASARAYPSRPVRIVVGFAAGGQQDILARLLGQWLWERLGQQFIVENRAGAGGTIATETVARAPADGHTLLSIAPSIVINGTLSDKLNFNFVRDIAPVATLTRQPLVMLVNPSFPAKTVPEFIAHAKANPGKINMASAGIGTGQHLTGELFKMMTGIDMTHVPYRGGAPAITDLIAGQVQVTFASPQGLIEPIKAGQLRALAVTTATRSEALPDVPPVSDFVPGFEATAWFGVGAPMKTPIEIVDKLNREFNAALTDPGIKARIADMGATPFVGSPAAFGKHIADEIEKWGKVVKFAGFKPA